MALSRLLPVKGEFEEFLGMAVFDEGSYLGKACSRPSRNLEVRVDL